METSNINIQGVKIAFALTGSFCTFSTAIEQMKKLSALKAEIIPIMSENAYSTDTRFGMAEEFRRRIEGICDKKIIHTIKEAEPIGPSKMADILIIAPCTGNTLAKLSGSITDTAVVD